MIEISSSQMFYVLSPFLFEKEGEWLSGELDSCSSSASRTYAYTQGGNLTTRGLASDVHRSGKIFLEFDGILFAAAPTPLVKK